MPPVSTQTAIASASAEAIEGAPARKKPKRIGLQRVARIKDAVPAKIIAYDFETTRIAVGTPRPVYLTAYGEKPAMHFACEIRGMHHLALVLQNNFLIADYDGVKFVAWNGNNFDAYFVAAALLMIPGYTIRPYLTRGHALRGFRVYANDSEMSWEFLDGIAMLGLVGTSLAKFTASFAPTHQKLTGVIDFDKEEFDPKNKQHQQYAMQDSISLWHGMIFAQNILIDRFNQPLAVTMGGACIKIFKAHIPEDANVRPLDDTQLRVIREYVMRGGFCYSVKPYRGKVWKYDLNQAYAAAMREAMLPSGYTMHSVGRVHQFAQVFIARIRATHPSNRIPFYCRSEIGGRVRSGFFMREIPETWITSIEYRQLESEGWRIEVIESYLWDEHFSMTDYVDKLERGRMSAEGGPSGAIGTVYKNVGNHSYGKTVEVLTPEEIVLANECPPGYLPMYPDGDTDPLEHVFLRALDEDEFFPKDYHQPQLGAFITAYVRMVVRRATLIDPDAWLYADTDCVVFTRDITDHLDIHDKRYGAWKIEDAGVPYVFIAKKVYAQLEGAAPEKLKRSAKGLHVKKLSQTDFEQWFVGNVPAQDQVQRNNFIRVMQGGEMYRLQNRKGTAVHIAPGSK